MLRIENVNIRFNNQPNVVSNMNMTLNPMEKKIIIGETGSGKSVLMQAIIKLLPSNTNIEGNIIYKDYKILNMNENKIRSFRRNEISYIPQGSGNGLNPVYKIKHQMIERLNNYKNIKKENFVKITSDILKRFGFENSRDIVEYYPHMLSGGMNQRILIGIGVMNNPNLILADEPTKGLDVSRVNQVIDAFKSLEDKTLLCVTHDLRFAKEIATRISVMYASYEIEECSREDFFENPLHPYSKAIIKAMPENGLKVNMGFAPSKVEVEKCTTCLFYKRCPIKSEKCLTPPSMIEVGERKVRCWNYVN